MARVTERIGEWIDKDLESCGLTRKDFRIRFKIKGKRYYLETFKLGWWIVSTLMMVSGMLCFYGGLLLMFALRPF